MRPDGTKRIRWRTGIFYVCFKDGCGRVVQRPTGCREEAAARAVLADLEHRVRLVRAGVISAQEGAVADQAQVPIADHMEQYLAYLKARGGSKKLWEDRRRYLKRLQAALRWGKLSDLERNSLERFLFRQLEEGKSARLVNATRSAAMAFGNWAVKTSRFASNPFLGIEKANEATDRRRIRRALTDDEIIRLTEATKRRPLEDALLIRRGARKGISGVNLSPETRRRLERLGQERALVYKTLILTGLRRGELASLTVGSLELDAPAPFAVLEAKDEKNRRGSKIPLRADLVADLRQHLAKRLAEAQEAAQRAGRPIPIRLSVGEPLFTAAPYTLVKALRRDLKAAGIPVEDERGRVVDVHSLRTTFATHLCRGGIPLRTAQAALRHSTPTLTANVYTDPQLLDVRGALDVLPAIPLGPGGGKGGLPATGTSPE